MLMILVCLIVLSATFAGLTLGMFSMGVHSLERKMKLGNKDAEKIYSVRKNGNFLLCTLLLGNVAVNSAIALVMAEVSTGVIAGIVSTGAIFIFGEVIPQSLFARHAFKIGAKTTWIVKIFMFLMWPIAKPLSMILDKIFGKELAEYFDKQELEALIEEHVENSIDSDEKRIMIGAMNFSDKVTMDVITPSTVLYSIESSTVITKEILDDIYNSHYSRIPVYENDKNCIVGILFAKDLITYNEDFPKTAKDLCDTTGLILVGEDYKLDSLLNFFIKSKKHMSFIYNQFNSLTGIVTLEDIIETILSIEILDEKDTVSDMQHLAKSSNKVQLMTDAIN